ncbi:major facilitator superfamily domain-containing protein [Zychaea mexicana]|uniref:major facilitator superfamily domain-containing protein n=1 Tax=Zychaea mexicana TaxID=64656 RepID=UPI0022FF00E1|nr:major facilitator superfamily domain-containing protein [Zychaea mexicana]KAI9495757.1 major facilitator superfamily domain-containing protein [Zychaea mexicana]
MFLAALAGFSCTVYYPGIPNIIMEFKSVIFCNDIGRSAFYVLHGAVINNIWGLVQRGRGYSKFVLGNTFGPLIGPMIGGFLVMTDLTWRATFWLCAGLVVNSVIYVSATNTSVEGSHVQVLDDEDRATTPTIHLVIDSKDVEKQQQREKEGDTLEAVISSSSQEKDHEREKSLNLFRPFALLRYPNIALSTVLAIETVIPILYERIHSFNSWQTGGGLGNICGVLVNSQLSDRLLLRARGRRGGREKWIPIVAFGIQTFGMNQVMTGVSAYLLDAVPGRGASAVAAGNVIYNVFACLFAVAGTPMVDSIGPGYLSVFVAGLSWLAACGLIILKIYGQRMRRRSGFLQDREREV